MRTYDQRQQNICFELELFNLEFKVIWIHDETHITIFGSFCYCCPFPVGFFFRKNYYRTAQIFDVWASYHMMWEFLFFFSSNNSSSFCHNRQTSLSSINAHRFDFISFCFQLICCGCVCVRARMLIISYYTYIIPLLSKNSQLTTKSSKPVRFISVYKCVCVCVSIYSIL